MELPSLMVNTNPFFTVQITTAAGEPVEEQVMMEDGDPDLKVMLVILGGANYSKK